LLVGLEVLWGHANLLLFLLHLFVFLVQDRSIRFCSFAFSPYLLFGIHFFNEHFEHIASGTNKPLDIRFEPGDLRGYILAILILLQIKLLNIPSFGVERDAIAHHFFLHKGQQLIPFILKSKRSPIAHMTLIKENLN
jgi:hypothetical protein